MAFKIGAAPLYRSLVTSLLALIFAVIEGGGPDKVLLFIHIFTMS